MQAKTTLTGGAFMKISRRTLALLIIFGVLIADQS